MKNWNPGSACVACVMLLCLMASGLALGQVEVVLPPDVAPQSTDGPAPVNLGPYQGMAAALSLTEDQQSKIRDQYAKMQEAQRKFLEANQKAWADAMEKAADAEAKAAVEGKAEVAKLQAQYDAITAAEHAKVMGTLTKEQALKWERQELETAVVAAMFPVQVGAGPDGMMAQRQAPTDTQKAIILKACSEVAAKIQASPNPYDAAKRKEATAKLIEQVREALAKANALPAGPDEK